MTRFQEEAAILAGGGEHLRQVLTMEQTGEGPPPDALVLETLRNLETRTYVKRCLRDIQARRAYLASQKKLLEP